MCGICGLIDFKAQIQAETLKQMCRVLSHRGPDYEGVVLIRGDRSFEMKQSTPLPSDRSRFEVGLGHRRLSIIDLSEVAHQPMSNEYGTVWIVFNGEIYNFQEIRRDLEAKGYRFKSRSDTEAILHAYEEWGIDCLKLLRGMFAFAIWDSNLKRLFIARDRLGKKPLVYLNHNRLFAFASELKALLQIPGVDRKVNERALHDYLTYQYVPSPHTIFEGIYKLPPAHYLITDSSGNLKVERYWKLRFPSAPQEKLDEEETKQLIRQKLEESVKLRLISDVPLGAFLSGGIDSSLVVGIMAKLSDRPVKTFSIGFEEEDFDELDYARIVAKHFSTDHHEFIVRPDAIEILPKLVWYYNEPFADSSAIPTYYVSKLTRDHVKVVLSGDAGDEDFAGYGRYLLSKWVRLITKVPGMVRRGVVSPMVRLFPAFHAREARMNRLADFLEVLGSDQDQNYLEQIRVFSAKEKKDIYTDEYNDSVKEAEPLNFALDRFRESETDDWLDRILYVDINTYLPEDLLVKTDIATMAHSLEARVPFLDHPFMEFVATIPSRLKLKGSVTKYILKEAYADFLPEGILTRKKMGFGVPVARWFRNELKNFVHEMLLDSRSLKRGYFKKEGLERLLRSHEEKRYDHSSKIWALLFLEQWFRMFVDQRGEPEWM
jgi:asparagine synthase (glutamine-hydrolysing)